MATQIIALLQFIGDDPSTFWRWFAYLEILVFAGFIVAVIEAFVYVLVSQIFGQFGLRIVVPRRRRHLTRRELDAIVEPRR